MGKISEIFNFDNIGGKIKTLAKTLTILGIIGSVIFGFVLFSWSQVLFGLLTIVFGSLVSWISSFALYGLGVLIDNSEIIAQHCISTTPKTQKTTTPSFYNCISTTPKTQKTTAPATPSESKINATTTPSVNVTIHSHKKKYSCPNCSSEVSARRKFCHYCGHDLKN